MSKAEQTAAAYETRNPGRDFYEDMANGKNADLDRSHKNEQRAIREGDEHRDIARQIISCLKINASVSMQGRRMFIMVKNENEYRNLTDFRVDQVRVSDVKSRIEDAAKFANLI